MIERLVPILVGLTAGFIARVLLLRTDYRNYPSSPNGVLIHLTVAFIASALGAVAVPALLSHNYVAVTFLALAIQQLRAVRGAEHDSLMDLEKSEFVPRGNAYIDGLAKGFESRNYVSLLVALTSTIGASVPEEPVMAVVVGVIAGVLVFILIGRFTGHRTVKELADVRSVPVRFEGYKLCVDDVYVENIGMESQRERIAREALGVILEPRGLSAQITFASYGQRQAILHEIARRLGVKRFYGSRRDFSTGRVAFYFVPMNRDSEALVRSILNVPILESTRRDPMPSQAGKGADTGE